MKDIKYIKYVLRDTHVYVCIYKILMQEIKINLFTQPPMRRASLNPPPESNITWDEYVVAPPGQCPLLGRNLVYKESSKSFKATVAMSPDFPLTVDMLLNVLEVITPFKHLSKLRQFVLMKLPPGFPVKIDIPILPTVTAKITFQEFAFRNDIDPELFQVPSDYFEDPMR